MREHVRDATIPEPRISIQPLVLAEAGSRAPPHLKQQHVASADGSVNGKNDGRKRSREPGPNIAREQLERRLQVGHRDVVVDGEPLDLVEHRRVRGVGTSRR